MLCQFTVKDYKSIRDEITFDMQAAAISEHENKIIKDIDGELFFRTVKAEYRYILHVREDEVVSDVLKWFEDAIDFLNYGNLYQELRTAIAKTEDIKHLVLNRIKEMDLDIEDFRIEEKDNDRIEIFTKHTVDGYSAEITLSEESSGTRKLFGLLPFIAKSLIYGTTLVIDELDAKLHPVLLQ